MVLSLDCMMWICGTDLVLKPRTFIFVSLPPESGWRGGPRVVALVPGEKFMRRCWVVVLVLMEKKKTRVIHVLDDDEALTCTHKYNIHLHKKEFMQEVCRHMKQRPFMHILSKFCKSCKVIEDCCLKQQCYRRSLFETTTLRRSLFETTNSYKIVV
ncbi:hypothetical protein HanIR_Chr08g0367661 [Helianthus annuus]|nr:hypothetical protein HanIR_Chr08g0367661 [Helianthus annuus]